MPKKRAKANKQKSPVQGRTPMQNSYEVSWEPIVDRKFQNLPQNIREELDGLYQQISAAPGNAIPRLLELKREYPKLPLIYNYLSIAYGNVDREKQKECIRENYEKNPGYLFARCNYAQLCIQQGEYEMIPEIFERKYDLKLLYPRRSRFHVTEFISFTHAMGLYFNAIGDRKQAEMFYQQLQENVPDADETKEMKRALYPGFFRRIGKRLIAFLEK